MAVGRFRVKANIDLPTATKFAAALESLGAVCSVVDASSGKAQPASAAPPASAAITPPPRPAPAAGLATVMAPGAPPPPKAGAASAGAKLPARADPSPAPGGPLSGATPAAAPAPPAQGEYASGLAAAFSSAERESQTDLGAITEDTGSFSLATLDGADEAPPVKQAHVEQAATPALSEEAFLPPEEAEGQERGLELAVDTSSKPRHTPPPMPAQEGLADDGDGPQSMLAQMADMQGSVEQPRQTPAAGVAPPVIQSIAPTETAREENPLVRARGELARRPQLRFAAGVFLAVLLGFVPAHFVAALRESSAYDEYREEVRAIQAKYLAAKTQEDLHDLELQVAEVRKEKMGQMESKRTNIAITGVLVWALAGGGIGFAWFRKIDWDAWA